MKFFNLTQVPDSILKPVISAAGRRIGAKTENTVVRVTGKHYRNGVSGVAHSYYGILWSALGKKRKGYCTCNGYIELSIPVKVETAWGPMQADDTALYIANRLWECALHEWAHIRDYQKRDLEGPRGRSTPEGTKRRLAWRKRPCEIRAMNATDDALKVPASARVQEAMLQYAIWLTESRG